MVELTKEEYEELRYSQTQYKNMSDIHDEYIEQVKRQEAVYEDRIQKLENRIKEIQKQQNSDKKTFDTAIDLLSGVDMSEIKEKPDWLIYFLKIRILYGQLTPKSAGYWKDMITNIYHRIDKQIKNREFDSIYISEKMRDMINDALEKQGIKST